MVIDCRPGKTSSPATLCQSVSSGWQTLQISGVIVGALAVEWQVETGALVRGVNPQPGEQAHHLQDNKAPHASQADGSPHPDQLDPELAGVAEE